MSESPAIDEPSERKLEEMRARCRELSRGAKAKRRRQELDAKVVADESGKLTIKLAKNEVIR